MTVPDPPSPHVAQDLPGLLHGDLGRGDTRRVSGHLRVCDDCRADLVDAAVALGSVTASMRTLADAGDWVDHTPAPDSAEGHQPLPPLRIPPAKPVRRRGRLLAAVGAVAAAGALFAAGASVASHRGGGSRPAAVLASAPLRPLAAPPDAGGKVTLARSGTHVVLAIHITGLPAPGPYRFYEAWLLNPATNKMMAMGVLAPAPSTTFEVEEDLIQGYSAVDISLQADNGEPAHSTTSVLRATQL